MIDDTKNLCKDQVEVQKHEHEKYKKNIFDTLHLVKHSHTINYEYLS